MKKTLAFIALALAGAAFFVAPVAMLTGCASAQRAAASEAEAAFREQNRACKRQYVDVAAQDACREKVAESWGVTYTPRRDAGKDAQ